ncbi:MAG: type I restriction enzyme HsdR N-terminal domain-containing protein [Chlamydiota bacterium]
MASSKSSRVYDKIRNLWVAALPEELVRQKVLHDLLRLGYPKGCIAIEKEIRELPHITSDTPLPNRRVDILCYAANIHPDLLLCPLLLIECKETLIRDQALEQVFGYNEYVKAPFCAIVSRDEIRMSYKVNKETKFIFFLPSYQELVNAVR